MDADGGAAWDLATQVGGLALSHSLPSSPICTTIHDRLRRALGWLLLALTVYMQDGASCDMHASIPRAGM